MQRDDNKNYNHTYIYILRLIEAIKASCASTCRWS